MQLQSVASELDANQYNTGTATLLKQEKGGYLLHLHFENNIPKKAERLIQDAMHRWTDWRSVILSSPQEEKQYGVTEFELSIKKLRIRASSRTFLQNHPEQSANIYEEIVRYAEQQQCHLVLDLYCGIGITSLLLAQQGIKVIGIEWNQEAIALAQQNLHLNALEDLVSFHAEPVEAALQRLKKEPFDLVVVNPPRTGLSQEASEALLSLAPLRILYVSCMPSTLARDAALFTQHGYAIEEISGWDMFPQTAHVETLVIFSRNF
jgi:23S rRNA (uracil1939-C5)-methyltransferase